MPMDPRAQMLEAVESGPRGVREVIKKLRWRPSRAISLSRKMRIEGLIELQQVKQSRRGRPKKIIFCTPLGFDFLRTYRKLMMKPLRARKKDLERAAKDASYAERLVASGHSPFRLFMELNAIVHNIEISSKAPEAV